MSEIGFIFLHTLFIQKGRLETTWTVLRTFGYGDDLSLREDFLYPALGEEGFVEMSSDGYQFLTDKFLIFDKDNDGALNDVELENLFATAPSIPWKGQGVITLQAFLAQWSMLTLLDYKKTLAYLAYLGCSDTPKALKVVRKNRDVFLCFVFGAAGSGKSTILRSFVDLPFEEHYAPTTAGYSVVNSVEINGCEKYLVLQECGPSLDAEILQNRRRMDQVDIILMVYDSTDTNSFAYLAGLRERFDIQVPCVYVATKADLDLVAQRYAIQPDTYCRSIGASVPMSVSMKTGGKELYTMLVGACMIPYYLANLRRRGQNKKGAMRYITATAIGVCVLAIAMGVYYRFKK